MKYVNGSVDIVAFITCLSAYNFSHRIDHLSFGELIPGIINPLDGTEKIASDCKCKIREKMFGVKEVHWDSSFFVVMEVYYTTSCSDILNHSSYTPEP